MLALGSEDGLWYYSRSAYCITKISLHSICPGKDIASNNAFVILASMLATINIVPALDEHGQPIPVNAERPLRTLSYVPLLPINCSLSNCNASCSAPDPFQCKFTPRSEAAMSLVQETMRDLQCQ